MIELLFFVSVIVLLSAILKLLRPVPVSLLAVVVLLACICPVWSAEESDFSLESEESVASEGNIPVKIIGGRLVANVEISTIYRRISANLFIDFDNPCGLCLHNNIAGPLKTENEFGETTPITIHFPDLAITVPSRQEGPEDVYGEFTRLHSTEINEEALVGTIGANVLNKYTVTFDLQKGRVELALPVQKEDSDDKDVDQPPSEEELEVAVTTTKHLVWLPVQLKSGKVHAMAVSTMSYDSLIDKQWCNRLGAPAGDVGAVKLGDFDLGSFVAFRPSEIIYEHSDGALGVMGLNLLKHLRLTIDRKNKTAVCRITAEPDFPESDRDFFRAMAAEDADKLEACLEKYPNERLSAEAAELLLSYRLNENAATEKIESAIRRFRITWRKDMVSTNALGMMRKMLELDRPMLAVFAGEIGIEGGRQDRYPNSVHQLHATLGEILLDQDEDKRAWRHLLSAAFGVPDDGPVNLNLGRFYEKQKRYNRALSRYVQAVIKVETGEKALEGLDRVQRKMGSTQSLSVDTIEPLIAGKTYCYAAATRYRPEKGEETNRVSLVEFFTNAHYKKPGKEEGAIGAALGNEGVMTYFPRDKVAMLTYHLTHEKLELDSLVNRFAQSAAAFYRVPPAVHLVNGKRQFTGEGHLSDVELIFKEGRNVVLASLKEKSNYKLEMTSSIEGDKLSGSLKVTDLLVGNYDNINLLDDDFFRAPPTVHIVLAERGVLYPGKSKIVIHRMVARAGLTDKFEGLPFDPKEGRMTIPFSRSLSALTEANVDFLKKLQAAGAGKAQTFAAKMDPRQLTVVAFVRDRKSKEILQAIQINPKIIQDEEGGSSE